MEKGQGDNKDILESMSSSQGEWGEVTEELLMHRRGNSDIYDRFPKI